MTTESPSTPPAQRIVVKVGSALLAPSTADGARLSHEAITTIAAGIHKLCAQGAQVVLVSSGSIACGLEALGLNATPAPIDERQAAAAIGQPALIRAYADAFSAHRMQVAQVLVTADDVAHKDRFHNARRTVALLLTKSIVPIVNENDSVSIDEIKLGDNDQLSALVAGLIDADTLLILSSAGGVREGGPSGDVIAELASVEDALAHVDDSGAHQSVGTGGMTSKLNAARTATSRGVRVIIAGGPDDLTRFAAGEPVGTTFPPADAKSTGKQWIALVSSTRGTVHVDAGAQRALIEKGASLLPGGITRVAGEFNVGAVVDIAGPDGSVFARGLTSYTAAESRAIAGKKSHKIEQTLGYVNSAEVIHRDNLVLLPAATTSPTNAHD